MKTKDSTMSSWASGSRAFLLVAVTVAGLCVVASYILTQQPMVWCHDESAGIALCKGRYRSWSMHYSDGKTIIDGQWQVVTITTNGMRKGYHWPKFRHVDMKFLKTWKPVLE